MISVNTAVVERPKTQDYTRRDALRCYFIIQPHNIPIVTSDSFGVISFLFMRIKVANIILNIH